jgi:hypothetical protein
MGRSSKKLEDRRKFIENFVLRVAVGNTLSNEAVVENGVVQGVVLGVTLFLIAMSEICDRIQEPVKIIGYEDDWMILASHKQVRTIVKTEYKRQCIKSPNRRKHGFSNIQQSTYG